MGELNIDTYQLEQGDAPFTYEFYSEGSKRVKKIIKYQQMTFLDHHYYNLAFGDWNEECKLIDDKSVTNNDDRDKILATVAASVVGFMKMIPNAVIVAEGSTASRTRLYQISIGKFWKQISMTYEIRGWVNNQWEPFQKGKNYESFFIKRRN